MIPDSILHYTIEKKLGEGGMGEVFLATDTKLDRKVALKFLPPHYTQDPEFKSRFEHEARAAAALNHPNIVTIHDLLEHEGHLFIAMEYIEGEPLESLIKKGGIALEQAIEITQQILEGLTEAHRAGIVHRDIKPSNIIVTKAGRAKILDFGLARSHKATTQTKSGTTLGTLQYESPEQVAGKQVDQRSDLFSVGSLLYEMVTGRTPFQGEFEGAIRYSILNEEPEPLARYKSGVSGGLQTLVDKVLTKDPSLRYQHADDMRADLKRLQSTSAPVKRSWTAVWVLAAMALALGSYLGFKAFISSDAGTGQPERKMLAVLPFENLGAPEDEYFADGITEEITSRLASVAGLGVISRTSAMSFKGTTKKLQQIAAELGVDYILEGTIRWDQSGDTDRVRITPQLIRVSDDTHLWADNYDRSLDQIFTVQTNIATNIVEALGVALLEGERAVVGASLTDSPEAYDYYLRSISFYRRGFLKEDLLIAVELAERALALDSGFAQAYAQLSRVHSDIYWFNHDRSPTRLESAKKAADVALRIAPNAVESHLALAVYYYHGSHDYEHALRELAVAEQLQPNEAQVYDWRAAIERRMAHWDQSISNFRIAIKLDPLDPQIVLQGAFTHRLVRDFKTADSLFQRARALLPDMGWAYIFPAHALVSWRGDIDAARKIMQEAEERVAPAEIAYYRAELEMVDRNYTEALRQLATPTYGPFGDTADFYNWKGLVYRRLGDKSASLACYDSAKTMAEAKVLSDPNHPMYLRTLAQAYAGLGMREKSLEMCQRSVEALPMSEDAIGGTATFMRITWVLVDLEEYKAALDNLEILLGNPSWITVNNLRLDPRYDPLRDHPRFMALLEKYKMEPGT